METHVICPQSQPCSWCCRESPLYVGAGSFRDFDSDLSYGIPICGGCGGLGRVIDTADFKTRARHIVDLRFLYCPTADDPLGPLPPCLLYERLNQLITAITEMHHDYGIMGEDQCLAKKIACGGLSATLRSHRENMEKQASEIRAALQTQPERGEILETLALCAEGKLDEAENRFKTLIGREPNSGMFHHDYGVALLNYRRDPRRALPLLLRSTELPPQKSLHFWQTAQVLMMLGETRRSLDLIIKIRQCPDFNESPEWFKKIIAEQAKLS